MVTGTAKTLYLVVPLQPLLPFVGKKLPGPDLYRGRVSVPRERLQITGR
jgi:hypothetical protein